VLTTEQEELLFKLVQADLAARQAGRSRTISQIPSPSRSGNFEFLTGDQSLEANGQDFLELVDKGFVKMRNSLAVVTPEGLAWRSPADALSGRTNPLVAQRVEQVRTLLQEPRFEGADQQFQKALDHLNKRPEPDKENCVKDAVGAVEAVTRILSGDPKLKLSDALGKEPFRSGIHPTLRVAIEKLYAYRGDVGGVAHGQVGPSQVGIEEAEWALTTALAAILYLVKKFGHLKE